MFSLTDYEYDLSEELIAQSPFLPPEQARLLIYDRRLGTIQDKHFFDLPALLSPQTLLVFNDSKVVKAKVLFPDIDAEFLFLRAHTAYDFEALVSSGKQRAIGKTHTIAGSDVTFTVTGQNEQGKVLSCSHPILDVLDTYGQMPLPPYIAYNEHAAQHYQAIVANHNNPGSVAAPTAALHFTEELLGNIRQTGATIESVTLHIGIGTFRSVVVDNIADHVIHEEIGEIDPSLFTTLALQKTAKKPILAIGTTSTRTLESLPYLRMQLPPEQKDQYTDTATRHYRDTLTKDIPVATAQQYISQITIHTSRITFASKLYIFPGYTFRIIDQLITNFHLPKTSLLMMIAGYIGYEPMRKIYTHAIDRRYRFFSFGDGMRVM